MQCLSGNDNIYTMFTLYIFYVVRRQCNMRPSKMLGVGWQNEQSKMNEIYQKGEKQGQKLSECE